MSTNKVYIILFLKIMIFYTIQSIYSYELHILNAQNISFKLMSQDQDSFEGETSGHVSLVMYFKAYRQNAKDPYIYGVGSGFMDKSGAVLTVAHNLIQHKNLEYETFCCAIFVYDHNNYVHYVYGYIKHQNFSTDQEDTQKSPYDMALLYVKNVGEGIDARIYPQTEEKTCQEESTLFSTFTRSSFNAILNNSLTKTITDLFSTDIKTENVYTYPLSTSYNFYQPEIQEKKNLDATLFAYTTKKSDSKSFQRRLYEKKANYLREGAYLKAHECDTFSGMSGANLIIRDSPQIIGHHIHGNCSTHYSEQHRYHVDNHSHVSFSLYYEVDKKDALLSWHHLLLKHSWYTQWNLANFNLPETLESWYPVLLMLQTDEDYLFQKTFLQSLAQKCTLLGVDLMTCIDALCLSGNFEKVLESSFFEAFEEDKIAYKDQKPYHTPSFFNPPQSQDFTMEGVNFIGLKYDIPMMIISLGVSENISDVSLIMKKFTRKGYLYYPIHYFHSSRIEEEALNVASILKQNDAFL